MTMQIAIVVDHCQNDISPATFALMTSATRLQAGESADIHCIIAGRSVRSAAEQMAGYTSSPILGLELGGGDEFTQEEIAGALLEEFKLDPPDYILISHSAQRVPLAAALAVGLNGACITGVEKIVSTAGGHFFKRSTHGGKFLATIASEAHTTVLTIQPDTHQPPEVTLAAEHQIEIKPVEPAKSRIKWLGRKAAVAGAADLDNARVVIAAGQGIGDSDNLELIDRLAASFANAAVAGSRIVCDLGWLDYSRQIGVSGNTVAPDLYIACGISGAAQHLAGMRGSKFVVALNTDPNAAIFREADVCIAEDLTVFIPALIAALEQRELQK